MTQTHFLRGSAALALVLAVTALASAPVYAQSCSFSGTLEMNPEILAASEPVKGNADADLLVTEFFDPNCPHCQRFHPVMQNVLASHGDDIRFFMQPVPLWQFSNEQMRAIFIAKQKGKYYEMIDAQLESPNAGKGGMTTEQIVALAEEIGLDTAWFRNQLSDASVMRTQVRRLSYEARKAGIESTPTLAIGRKIVGNRSADCIGQLIEQELGADSEASASSEKR